MAERGKRKKKVDYEALNSPLMRIPRMDVTVARALIDMNIRQVYELEGRSPEVLYEEALRKGAVFPADPIRYFRMAVYYAESKPPDPTKLHPDAWRY